LCEQGELEGGRDAEHYVAAVRERGLLEGLEIRPPRGLRISEEPARRS
jgi:hypothetical protein